jgi:hypothetical protein
MSRAESVQAKHSWGVWMHAIRPVPELVRLAVAAEDLGATALLALVAELRAELTSSGPEAAGRLVPDQVLGAFAITGDRADVVTRLATVLESVAPELLVFEVQDYDTAHIAGIAALAAEAGAR